MSSARKRGSAESGAQERDRGRLAPAAAGVTNKGAVLTLPDLFGITNGYRFACWTCNGAALTDQLGDQDFERRVESLIAFVRAATTVRREEGEEP